MEASQRAEEEREQDSDQIDICNNVLPLQMQMYKKDLWCHGAMGRPWREEELAPATLAPDLARGGMARCQRQVSPWPPYGPMAPERSED